MTRRLLIICSTGLLLATSLPAAAFDCRHTADRDARGDLDDAKVIEIRAGAGSLKIIGKDGMDEIRATGQACSSKKSLLEEIEIAVTRDGEILRITAELPETRFAHVGLDMAIEIPDDLPLDVKDSSGDMEVRDVGPTRIRDSSGSIHVQRVGGTLGITDSSGGIEAHAVDGDATVSDSSGDIEILDVTGSVVIENDSSGDIEIIDVNGNVRVNHDSSGSIYVKRVGGDFTVQDDSSGDIRHDRVAGEVILPASYRHH